MTFVAVLVLYAVLGVATVLILRTMARRWRSRPSRRTAEVPYGPGASPARRPSRLRPHGTPAE